MAYKGGGGHGHPRTPRATPLQTALQWPVMEGVAIHTVITAARIAHFPLHCHQIKGIFSLKRKVFSILANAKSSAGLLEMPDIRSAMEALTLTNHFTINPPGNQMKLNC